MSTTGSVPADRRVERAQHIWRSTRELADPLERHDRLALALTLLRTAHHDPIALTHALAVGRRQLRAQVNDSAIRARVSLLETAIQFLGASPKFGDAAELRRH